MKNEKNKTKTEDGLPDVAQGSSQKKPLILIMIGVVLAASIGMVFHTKYDRQVEKPVEETYTVAAEPRDESNKELPVTEKTTVPVAPAPQVSEEVMQQQIALIQEKQKELHQRLSAPLMVVSENQAGNATGAAQPPQAVSKDTNTQFMDQLSAHTQETAIASTIGPLNSVIAEGSFIHAILESATNSDLPGYLRASVSGPVYSEDGTQILVPRGSRLIGQYKSGMLQGQSRIFVVWTRLITPAGISVQLGSAGVDSLGVAGMGADEINRHFWQRFGTASLLSLLGAGAANVGVNGEPQENSASSYRAAVASSFSQSANQSLQQESMMAPTLKTYQGKPIMVFVARDLNFQRAMKESTPKMNVF
jgi:type IV secretion system protein VirB10